MFDPYDALRAGPSRPTRAVPSPQSASDGGGKLRDLDAVAEEMIKGHERGLQEEEVWTRPVALYDGVFKGKIVRLLLRCVQAPRSGRRKTERDRRPLAPVPIVRLWVKECRRTQDGAWIEEDLDPSGLDPTCLVCEAELSATPEDVAEAVTDDGTSVTGPISGANAYLYDSSVHARPNAQSTAEGAIVSRPPLATYSSLSTPAHEPLYPWRYVEHGAYDHQMPPLQHRASWVADSHWDTRSIAVPSSATVGPEAPTQRAYRTADDPRIDSRRSKKVMRTEMTDTDADDDEMDGRDAKKMRLADGRNLYGALHVTGVKVQAPSGEQGIWFLFTDLCVRYEGTYALRFKVFDMSLVSIDQPPVPHFASCASQSFQVYSPRSFPGLPKPTELSEHFMRQGFKLNTRKNERTAKSTSPPSQGSTPGGPSGTGAGADGSTAQHPLRRTPVPAGGTPSTPLSRSTTAAPFTRTPLLSGRSALGATESPRPSGEGAGSGDESMGREGGV